MSLPFFPKDVELRAKWIEAMDRPNWEPAPHSRLCSQHFQESAIDRTSLSCVRIREGAVPSIFNGVVKTVKSPVKRTTVPATPFKKLTLKEALEKREEIERELSLMNKEQNRIRKDRKTLLQVRRRKASKLEASKKLFSKISLSGQKEHYLFSLAESKRKLNKIDGELAISQEKKDKFMKRMISLKKEINYLSRIIIDYNSDIYTQVPSGEAGPSKKRVSAAASRGRSSISGEKKRKMGRKQMLKSSHDNDNESGAEDDPQQKDPFEMIDIVETTIKEEILYPEDSDDALMLQSGALQTKLQLKASEDAVPDDTAAVQELLTSLFTAVYNHQDEEGRCFSDSMQELPEHDEVEGKKLRALSLDLIKRRLDGGQYRGLDQFQEDLFSCMDRARKLSRTDSQVFEDSVELQSYFIRQRDELCLNGDLLHSPALNFTLLDLSAAVDLTRQQKLLQEQPEEEEQTRSSEDNTSRDGSSHGGLAVKVADNALSFNQQVCRIGDFVYAEPKERGMDPILLNIQRLWTNKEGQQMLYGNQYYRPRETYHVTTRKFLEKEVFKTDQHVAIPLNQVLGRCCVLSVKDFFRSRPDNFDEKDVYVCESQYSSKARVFRKIKNWPQSLTAGYKLLPREEALEPKRVMYVFRERVEKHKEEIAELEEREKLAEKEKPDPFEMIDIFERTIKEEILDPEDSDKMSNINILPDDKIFPDSSNFETVYCTPDPIKMEYEDGEPTNTETAVPECLPRIKQEPRDEFEEPEIEETQGGAKLMWRCPIVTCPEMFSAEVEMYHHYNLNHAVKGPALPSKSKKMPVSSPLITTGLLLFATPVPSNSSGPITTTTASLVTTVVSSTTSSVPVVSSSSGPVVVTTTVTTTCAPLVTTSVSSAMLVSCVPVVSTTAPVTSPSLSVPAMQSAVPDDATSTPTTASTEVPSARVCETGSSNVGTYFLVSPPAKLSSHARQNINLTKINAQDSDVSAVKPANLSKKKHKDLANSSGAHIFNPTEPTLDDLPPCATDDTEMFSISLARFPQNRRVPIKRKLINVVDCIKQKNISADNILIAYYENSCDSRTM